MTSTCQTPAAQRYPADLQFLVFSLFFFFGGITSLNDVLIPKLRELFTLSYADAMLVQSAFFAAYLVISLPAAWVVQRIGYLRSAALGLATMAAGCVLFVPASASATFSVFLLALFVLASGITIVQVVNNPLISMLGKESTAHSRLTFAQAFNSLGTTLFPRIGSALILGAAATGDVSKLSGAALAAARATDSRVVARTYVGLAIVLIVMAAVVWLRRRRLRETPAHTSLLHAFTLLRQPRFAFGAASIFLYVGAEVAIGSLIVAYLMQPNVLHMSAVEAGNHVWFYWGGAMVGRFIGSYLLRVFSPGKVLATTAAVAIGLLALSANSLGAVSGWSLLAIGLFNSIMFPTIFSLASEGLHERAAEGSGIICVCICGGAVIPRLTGMAEDAWGLKLALWVPALCYGAIVAFGWYARRPVAGASTHARMHSAH